jgi:hypothetical protein
LVSVAVDCVLKWQNFGGFGVAANNVAVGLGVDVGEAVFRLLIWAAVLGFKSGRNLQPPNRE